MEIAIFSDNVAPYRLAWAEKLAKNNIVHFLYAKSKDTERNSSWLVKESKAVNLIKMDAKVVKNHAISFDVIAFIKKHPQCICIFDGYGTIPNILGVIYMKLKRKKYYINVDGVDLNAEARWLNEKIKKYLFSSKNAFFLCGSNYVRKWVGTYGVKEDHTMAHHFTSICEEDIISYVPTKEERDQKKQELGMKKLPTVLAVGRFLPLKQFDSLIKAFKGMDDKFQLLLIGEGNEYEHYLKVISELNVKNVGFRPFMKFNELKNYYFASELLVLPSYSETWGLVINEAMACGALPVVASDRCVGAIDLVHEDENGYIFQYKNVQELGHQIKKIFSNEKQYKLMCESSLKIISEYTIEKMAERHVKFLEQ